MTFEDFFRKKKIDLEALGRAEPALLAEFRSHFEQMGEKSFDHTKKYWFNKLRLDYHLPPDIREQKVNITGPLTEQTINETLSETIEPPANVGFKPRFKAAVVKPMGQDQDTPVPETEKSAENKPVAAPPAGFKPRFKAGVTKPAGSGQSEQPNTDPPAEDKPAESTDPKPPVGFKPRFNAKNMKPRDEN